MNSADTMGGIVLAIDRIPTSYSESNKINVYNNIVIANEIIDGSDILFRTETLPFPTPPPPNVELTPTNV